MSTRSGAVLLIMSLLSEMKLKFTVYVLPINSLNLSDVMCVLSAFYQL